MARGKHKARSLRRRTEQMASHAEALTRRAALEQKRADRAASRAERAQSLRAEIVELEARLMAAHLDTATALVREIEGMGATVARLATGSAPKEKKRRARQMDREASAVGLRPWDYVAAILSDTYGQEVHLIDRVHKSDHLPVEAAIAIQKARSR